MLRLFIMGITEQEKNYVPEIGEKEYVGRATEKLPDGNSLPCANFCVAVTVHFPSISSLVNGGPNGPGSTYPPPKVSWLFEFGGGL